MDQDLEQTENHEEFDSLAPAAHEPLIHLHAIVTDAEFIFRIPHPTNDELELAFHLRPDLAMKFEELPEDVQQCLIAEDPRNAKFINTPTKAVELLTVVCGLSQGDGMKYYGLFRSPNSLYAWFLAHPVLLSL